MPRVMADLDATVNWVESSGKGDVSKLGIIGVCWGGRIVWMYAAHSPKVDAEVAWYGRLVGQTSERTPTHPVDVVFQIHVPVLGLYAGADSGIPRETVEQMRAALQAAGSSSELHVYPDTPPGFHADYRSSYRKEAAQDSWQRLQAWFTRPRVA